MKPTKKVYKSRIKKLERAKYRAAKKEDKDLLNLITNTLQNKSDDSDDDDNDHDHDLREWNELDDKDPTVDPTPVYIEQPKEEEEITDLWYQVESYTGNPNPSIDITYDLFQKFTLLSLRQANAVIEVLSSLSDPVSRTLTPHSDHIETYLANNEKFEGVIAQDRSQFVAGAFDMNGHFTVIEGEAVAYIKLDWEDLNKDGLLFLSILTCSKIYVLGEFNELFYIFKGDHAKYIWNMVKNDMHNGLLWLEGYNISLECFPYEDSISACNWPYKGYNSDGILIDKDSLILHLLGMIWLCLDNQLIHNFLVSDNGEDILHYIINGVWHKLPEGFPAIGYINKFTTSIFGPVRSLTEEHSELLFAFSEAINYLPNEDKISFHLSLNK